MAESILSTIWKDYLCRIAAHPCSKPLSDDLLSKAASSNYRPGSTPPRLFGLQPGSTPEGIRTGLTGDQAYPDPQSPPAIPPGSGGNIPSPIKTSEVDQDEFRETGSGSGPGFVTLLAAQLQNDIDILEITIQMGAVASQVQLFRDGTPISGNFTLVAGQPWSAPGLTILRTQSISAFLGATAPFVFEVRWKWRTNAP